MVVVHDAAVADQAVASGACCGDVAFVAEMAEFLNYRIETCLRVAAWWQD